MLAGEMFEDVIFGVLPWLGVFSVCEAEAYTCRYARYDEQDHDGQHGEEHFSLHAQYPLALPLTPLVRAMIE